MPPLELPLGLGTSRLDDPAECRATVAAALEAGYRHVDTAQMYDNETAVGEGIATADVDRDDVVVATKIHPDNLAPADVRETARKSLDRLGLDRVDLLYVHWPTGAYDPDATLPAFDALREAGLTDHVGVSNFTPDLLREAAEILDAPIAAHQVECHPGSNSRSSAGSQPSSITNSSVTRRWPAGTCSTTTSSSASPSVTGSRRRSSRSRGRSPVASHRFRRRPATT